MIDYDKKLVARVNCIMKSLLMGIPVKIDNYEYVLSENNELCTLATKEYSSGETEKVGLPMSGDTLYYLIDLAKNVSDSDYMTIVANVNLNIMDNKPHVDGSYIDCED